VRTFDEPADIDDWVVPPDPDPSLLLITQGGMLMESRPRHGPWQRFVLHLDRHLVASVAEEVTGRDPARLSLLSPTGFRDPLLSELVLALGRELEDEAPAE
jgi:hypothetical protein